MTGCQGKKANAFSVLYPGLVDAQIAPHALSCRSQTLDLELTSPWLLSAQNWGWLCSTLKGSQTRGEIAALSVVMSHDQDCMQALKIQVYFHHVHI